MEYRYVAYGQDRKVIRGTQAAANEDAAAKLLTGQGFKVLTVSPVPTFIPRTEHLFPSLDKVKKETVVDFFRQLALLLESGMDIVAALALLRIQSSSKAFKSTLGKMITDLRKGDRLTTAMARHPSVFPKMHVHTIAVGEQAGGIEGILRQVADYMEKDARTGRNMRAALQYPMFVVIVAAIVIAVLAVFVFPVFVGLYGTLGAKLPTLTRMTLASMHWISSYGLIVAGILAGICVGGYFYGKTPAGKEHVDRMLLRVPLLGRIIHLNELVRCCRSMALLHKTGVPIPEIIAMIVETSNNGVFKKALVQLHQDVLKGQSISGSLSSNSLFLPMMVQMASVGERTGTLDATLRSAADAFEAEADAKTRSVIGLIQPVVTVALGLGVAVIALSLVSAMYSMYGQMG